MTKYAQNGGLTRFDTGGSHSQNPNGGIDIGNNNSVEENETKQNNFVYSNRIFLDSNIVSQYNLPKSLVGKSVADATKFIDNKFKGRNDKISQSTKNGMLSKIAEAQEAMKPQEPEIEQSQEGMIDPTQMAFGGYINRQMEDGGYYDQNNPYFMQNPGVVQKPVQSNTNVINQIQPISQLTQANSLSQIKPFSTGNQLPTASAVSDTAGAIGGGLKEMSGKTGLGLSSALGAASTAIDLGKTAFGKPAQDTSGLAPSAKVNSGGMIAGSAMKGASAGMAFGPLGAGIGAVVGGAAGLLGSKKAEKAALKNSNNFARRTNAQFSDQYALGGKIDPPIKTVKDQADFNNNWFSNRVINGKPLNVKSRVTGPENINIANLNDGSVEGTTYGQYDPSNKKITLDPRFNERIGIPAHEMYHEFQDKLKYEDFNKYKSTIDTPIRKALKDSKSNRAYDSDPEEISARLQQLRWGKDFKPDQVITPKDIEKVDLSSYDLQGLDKNSVVDLLNTVASNDIDISQTQFKEGGLINPPSWALKSLQQLSGLKPGEWGPNSQKALATWQKSKGLTAGGKYGPNTFKAAGLMNDKGEYSFPKPELNLNIETPDHIENTNYKDPNLSNLDLSKINNSDPVKKSFLNRASKYVNENAGNLARYAPIAANALQLSQLKKPQGERLDRLGNRYKPEYVDEAMIRNIVDQEANNQINALTQSGASQGAVRNAILGAGLNKTKALSDAYMNAAAQNRATNDKAQTFNLGVDQVNLQQSNTEKENFARDQAAYRNAKREYITGIGEGIGDIGKEQVQKKIIAKTTGYKWDGEYVKSPDGTVVTDPTTGKPMTEEKLKEIQSIKDKKALGGYLIKNKVK